MLSKVIQFSDPYPLYKELRECSPVYQDEDGTWFLTRYDDVKLLLSDQRFLRRAPQEHGFLNKHINNTPLNEVISHWAFFNDPPQHTHLRNILSSIFNPRFIKDIRSMIESIADSLLNSMLQQSEVDFMQAFAYLLPVNVVNHLLGTTLDLPTIRRWSLGLTAALDHGSPEDFQAITPDIIEMQEYFKQVIVMRELKKNEKNDWISGLIKLKQSNQLTLDELISTCIFLMLAGHETVQLTIGLGLMTLLKNPQQQLLLQENTELISSAVEEILRFDSPLNKLSRWTSEEIVLNDITIPKNQLVVGMLNAANRDPLKYTNPDKFDITRTNNRHLTFGCGIHNCLGALLARIELQVALSTLLPHLHKFTLIEDQIVWLPNTSLRYLFKMMISIKQ